jgi:endo-1,4-beta-xylanase
VLNEAINDNPPNPSDWRASLRQSRWYHAIGPEYVELVFLAVREADPEAKLYYNDYNLDNQSKSLAVYNMVKELNEKYPNAGGRALIDGIGMQGHYRTHTSPEQVALSLERFISLGVEVSITELDIQAGTNSRLTEKEATDQGMIYASLFTVFKDHSANIARVTFWGLDDGTSWRSPSNPTLFDKDLQAKPAFYAVENPADFLAAHQTMVSKDTKQVRALYGIPKIDGTLDPIWREAPEIPVNQFVMAWQGASGTAKVLWDDTSLYVLVHVQGAELNKSSKNAYEQDSVEVFIDENNGKTAYFEADDGQYRVNFANEASFNPGIMADGFVSAVSVAENSYTVAMKIPFKTISPKNNARIGFDVQINGASAQGIRQSIAVWNDTSGNSYQATSGYGVLHLTAKP